MHGISVGPALFRPLDLDQCKEFCGEASEKGEDPASNDISSAFATLSICN